MNKIKTFIVDDSAIVRNMLTRLLSSHDDVEVVGEAGSGPGCVIMLDELNPDIILLEAALSGTMSVKDVILEAKKILPEVLIILCTDPHLANSETILALKDIGIHDFISKPYKQGTLLRTIREAYASKDTTGGALE